MIVASFCLEAASRRRLQRPDSDQIEIEGTKFRVAGIFQANNPFDANSVVAPIADVQKLMERPGVVSEFQVRVAASIRDEAALQRALPSD